MYSCGGMRWLVDALRRMYPCGGVQVLLVRREEMGENPARNVKFLGNLRGDESEWADALEEARDELVMEWHNFDEGS